MALEIQDNTPRQFGLCPFHNWSHHNWSHQHELEYCYKLQTRPYELISVQTQEKPENE